MKKLLNIFVAVGLISTNILPLISCNKQNKAVIESKDDVNISEDDNNKDNDNKDKDDKDKDPKPLTAKEVANKIEKRFNDKKETFVNKLNVKTIAEFYKALEDEFKVTEEEWATIKNKDKKDKESKELVLDKIKDATNKVYIASYDITIDISVLRVVETKQFLEKRTITFDYIIPAEDIKIEPNIKNWKHKFEYNGYEEDRYTSSKKEEFPLLNQEKYNIDFETIKILYPNVTVDYEFEFSGCMSGQIKKTETKNTSTNLSFSQEIKAGIAHR